MKNKFSIRDITIFAVLGALMFISYMIMQGLPNVHLIGVFLGAVTLVYRTRALIALYIYVLLAGVFAGFSFWWLPHLYIWLPLWLAFMLAGKFLSKKKGRIPTPVSIGICMAICALHGLAYGIMYAPVQALFFGLSYNAMIAWIISGFTFDIIHAVSNFFLASLIIPLSELLTRLSGARPE